MPDLREQLQNMLKGRVCLVGVGNVDLGDDGFGVRLAEAVLGKGEGRREKGEGRGERNRDGFVEFALRPSDFTLRTSVFIAGQTPERLVGRLIDAGFDHVVFLDAVEFGAAPGSAVLLDAGQIAGKFPQVSTHKISLGLLARCLEAGGRTRAWLLGVQPESLKPSPQLTPAVEKTLTLLAEWLGESRDALPSEEKPTLTPALSHRMGEGETTLTPALSHPLRRRDSAACPLGEGEQRTLQTTTKQEPTLA
jgi:hydrogenase maturation protease